MPRVARAKHAKKPDRRPARARYWGSQRLQKRKVARLLKMGRVREGNRQDGDPIKITHPQIALDFWRTVRKGRIKTT